MQPPAKEEPPVPKVLARRRENRIRHWVELLSAVVLALATVATAWSGYQSAAWNGDQTDRLTALSTANIKTAKLTNLALQKRALHVGIFGQWVAAQGSDNRELADWLLDRFPEPLKTATNAWLTTAPLSNTAAPTTPFDMPEYVLAEDAEVLRWEATAAAEAEAARVANDIANRYLLFTIIFASVLFFGGIAGKFRWLAIDIATLVLGIVALLVGLAILLSSPIR